MRASLSRGSWELLHRTLERSSSQQPVSRHPSRSRTPRRCLYRRPAHQSPHPTPAPDPQARRSRRTAPAPAAPPAAPPVDLDTPFAFADFTWMLSNPRNHDEVLDGKYFSGEFRVDTNYMYDYNHPIDHTLDETTEGERTGEFVIQALGVGGDFHAGNMQGRILTQFGAVSTAVPRNDASYSLGQWDSSGRLPVPDRDVRRLPHQL